MNQAAMELTIRPFEAQDQEAVRKLILDGLGEHFPAVDATLNPDLDDIRTSYIQRGHPFLVAQLSGQIVGAGALIVLDGRIGRIARVSVAKGYRRQGVAAQIVTRLVELARERRFRRLVVETNHDWFEAIGLYRSSGFQPYGRDEVSLHMELALNDFQ